MTSEALPDSLGGTVALIPTICSMSCSIQVRSFCLGCSFVEHIGLLVVAFPGLICKALTDYCSVSDHQYDTFVSAGAD